MRVREPVQRHQNGDRDDSNEVVLRVAHDGLSLFNAPCVPSFFISMTNDESAATTRKSREEAFRSRVVTSTLVLLERHAACALARRFAFALYLPT